MLTATGLLASSPTIKTRARACEEWLPLWRIITSLDQVAELRARVVMVRRANITRMRLM